MCVFNGRSMSLFRRLKPLITAVIATYRCPSALQRAFNRFNQFNRKFTVSRTGAFLYGLWVSDFRRKISGDLKVKNRAFGCNLNILKLDG